MERPLILACAGEQLVAIVSEPSSTPRIGVLIVVGGPQYRVGSHRQFVLLAKCLSRAGIAVARFDYRGMGDSTGEQRAFHDTADDIAAAVSGFAGACPSLRHVVLWGLCDAASACLLYWHATADLRVTGMVLLNPWIRSEATLAKARLRHYYARRLVAPAFWVKLVLGRINVPAAWRGVTSSVIATVAARQRAQPVASRTFQERMASAIETFKGPILLITSGRDLTGKEFLDFCRSDALWQAHIHRGNVELLEIAGADHTFSSAALRQSVEAATLDWLKRVLVTPA